MKCDVFYFWLVFNAVKHLFVLRIKGRGSLLQRLLTSGCHPTRPVQIIIIFLL